MVHPRRRFNAWLETKSYPVYSLPVLVEAKPHSWKERLRHAIWQTDPGYYGENASNWERTFGSWNQKMLSEDVNYLAKVLRGEPNTRIRQIDFLGLVVFDPWIASFCFSPANEFNLLAFLNPLRLIDFGFRVLHGVCDWLATWGAYKTDDNKVVQEWWGNLMKPFAFLLRLPVCVVQNVWQVVAHPFDFFIKPIVDSVILWSQDKISGLKALFIGFLQALKISLTIIAIASVVGVPFAGVITSGMSGIISLITDSVPFLSAMASEVTAITSSIVAAVGSIFSSGSLTAISAATVAPAMSTFLTVSLFGEIPGITHGSNILADKMASFNRPDANEVVRVQPIARDSKSDESEPGSSVEMMRRMQQDKRYDYDLDNLPLEETPPQDKQLTVRDIPDDRIGDEDDSKSLEAAADEVIRRQESYLEESPKSSHARGE